MKKTSRRKFMQMASAAAVGSALVGRTRKAWSVDSTASIAVVPPLSVFDYAQVQLLPGLLREQFDRNHDVFLHLDEDAMLKPFRQREGMPAPGPDMGGWYDNGGDFSPPENFHSFIPGHSFGQYLSGLARAYAVTGSQATQEKVHRLVRAFGETVEPSGKFYRGYHLPAYTYDKTSCGLIDAHEFAKCPDALDIHWRATQAALPYLPDKALSRDQQRARAHAMVADTWDETYTLPENFFLAYRRSGRKDYRDLAVRFIGERVASSVAEIGRALDVAVQRHAVAPLTIGGIGALPTFRRARVIWMGIAPDPRLELLHHDIESACVALGMEAEGRPFRPHLTLARVPVGTEASVLRDLSRAARPVHYGETIDAFAVDLMASEAVPGGRQYTLLHSSPLGAAH